MSERSVDPNTFTTRYLERIGLAELASHELRADLDLLRRLFRAHILSVPFENLDIMRGTPLSLEIDDLYRKIVLHERGGFCYELNGLFSRLLLALGYKVDLLSGRVNRRNGTFGPEGDHLTLLVHLEKPYLVDVGFGRSFQEVLTLDGVAYPDPKGEYRVRTDDEEYHLEFDNGTGWITEYKFRLEPKTLADFDAMCRFHQTSGTFNVKHLCMLATKDGALILKENELLVQRGNEITKTPVTSMDEFWQLMYSTAEPFRKAAESIKGRSAA